VPFHPSSEDCERLQEVDDDVITNGRLQASAAGTIDGGWGAHGMALSWVSILGKNNVLYLEDTGMLSDLWQSFETTPGILFQVPLSHRSRFQNQLM
jgi:hypothetical protein